MINYTQDLYNQAVENKEEIENYLNEIYSQFDSFTFRDKVVATEIIDSLKVVALEYDKYIISYENTIKVSKTKNEYTVIAGDTLPLIAQKVMGDYSQWPKIYQYNNLKDLKLEPGDSLLIPEDN